MNYRKIPSDRPRILKGTGNGKQWFWLFVLQVGVLIALLHSQQRANSAPTLRAGYASDEECECKHCQYHHYNCEHDYYDYGR